MDKAKGGNPNLTRNRSHDATGSEKTLASLGISKTQSSRWQKLAAIPKDEFEATFAKAEIIARAGIRMANEIDAGQAKGEIARADGSTHHRRAEGVRNTDTLSATLPQIGVTRQRLAEWRSVRDANRAQTNTIVAGTS